MKNDRVFAFRQSVGKLVTILTDQNIEVTQRGTDAYVTADAKTGRPILVNIPHLPDEASEELLESINGFLDHEVAHVLFTDWKLVKMCSTPSIASMHNILEDCRIERLMVEKFRGSAYNLGTMGRFFLTHMTVPMLKKAMGAGDKNGIMSVLIPPMFRAVYGQAVFRDFMTKDMWDHVAPLWDKIKHLKPKIEAMSTPQDAYDLALEIDKLARVTGTPSDMRTGKGSGSKKSEGTELDDKRTKGKTPTEKKSGGKDPKKIEDEEAESLEGKNAELTEEKVGQAVTEEERIEDETGELDDTEEGVEASGSGDEDDDFAEKGKPAGERDSDGDFDDDGEGEGTGGPSDDSDFSEGGSDMSSSDFDSAMSGVRDFDSSMAESLGKVAKSTHTSSKYRVFTTDLDKIEKLPRSDRYKDSMLREMEDQVNHLVAPMQKDLERLIAARSASTWTGGYRSGRLHAANLSRLQFDDTRVFRRRHETTTKDVAVSLVVDMSGSMSGGKIKQASMAAFALSQVLERLSISHEVIAFTTYQDSRTIKELGHRGWGGGGSKYSHYSRWEPLYMPILKGFDERLVSDTKPRFADLPNGGLANNVDGECVEIAARRLLGRREKGKIMMVLSDGAPNCDGDSDALDRHLKKTVIDIEDSGIRVVGIGIMTEAPKKYYKRHVLLNDVKDLPTIVMKELKAALLQ